MSYLFSANFKFRTWRRLWIALAEAEQELGLPITDSQIADLKAHAEEINFDDAERREREVRHDVMAHVHAYGLQATSAKGIIHLGATSAYVTDNTDILQMAEGLRIVRRRIVNLMAKLRDFAWQWRATPTLDRKSTRLNSSHLVISYAVFCLKKKIQETSNMSST